VVVVDAVKMIVLVGASREAARLVPSGLRVFSSKSAGEGIPSVECRRRRLKKTSMYSKTSLRSSALVGHERPWMSSFLSVAKKLSATALMLLCQDAMARASWRSARRRG
jgi:hypothetical protein